MARAVPVFATFFLTFLAIGSQVVGQRGVMAEALGREKRIIQPGGDWHLISGQTMRRKRGQ